MLVEPDFSEVTDPVAPGTYKVNVVKAEPGKWEKDGKTTHYLNVEMETFDETEAKNNGRRIWDRVPYTGKGAFRMQRFYHACTGETLAGGFDTEQIIGKQLEVVVEQNGEYTNVKSVAALG